MYIVIRQKNGLILESELFFCLNLRKPFLGLILTLVKFAK